MSPYALAASLTTPKTSTRLYAAMTATLTEAVAEASGKPPAELKDAKRRGMQVHGRRGEMCPVCGDTVRSVFFADNSLEYCADVPDRWQDPRRPPPVAAAQVGRATRAQRRGAVHVVVDPVERLRARPSSSYGRSAARASSAGIVRLPAHVLAASGAQRRRGPATRRSRAPPRRRHRARSSRRSPAGRPGCRGCRPGTASAGRRASSPPSTRSSVELAPRVGDDASITSRVWNAVGLDAPRARCAPC